MELPNLFFNLHLTAPNTKKNEINQVNLVLQNPTTIINVRTNRLQIESSWRRHAPLNPLPLQV